MGGALERAERLISEFSHEARRSGSVPFMARVARSAARLKAERGEAHAAMLLSQEAVRGFAENGNKSELGAALRERAGIELHFGRADLARATLVQAHGVHREAIARVARIIDASLRPHRGRVTNENRNGLLGAEGPAQ